MEFRAILDWTRSTPSFEYKDYNRSHQVSFQNGIVIPASSAVEYLGTADRLNPEEMLLAALSSCHMLTFLAIASRSRLVIDSYQDHAHGVLSSRDDGKMWVSHVTLAPRLRWAAGSEPDPKRVKEMHEKSHRNCFIANSVKTQVVVEGV